MRMRTMQVANQRRDIFAAEAERRDDAQMAADAGRLAGHARRNRFDALEDLDRFLNELLTFVGQRDAAGRARGHANAETFLDALKPDRRRRRRQIEQPRGRRERLRGAERAEQLHVFELKH